MSTAPPDSYSFSTTFIISSLLGSAAIAYGLGYAVLSLIPDPRAPPHARGRWTDRRLDFAWFAWMALHIPITLLVDCQHIYPAGFLPQVLLDLMSWYTTTTRDPVMIGATTGSRDWAWMNIFLHMELVLQTPCFILGALGLWHNDKRVYPLLLLYGTTTATTVIPTLYYVMTETVVPAYTSAERLTFLATYVPFLLIPLGIVADMMVRIVRLINKAEGRGVVVTEIKKRS